jgi:hypothetical protein
MGSSIVDDWRVGLGGLVRVWVRGDALFSLVSAGSMGRVVYFLVCTSAAFVDSSLPLSSESHEPAAWKPLDDD